MIMYVFMVASDAPQKYRGHRIEIRNTDGKSLHNDISVPYVVPVFQQASPLPTGQGPVTRRGFILHTLSFIPLYSP